MALFSKYGLAMKRLVENSDFENMNLRDNLRFFFWDYLLDNDFEPVEISRMPKDEISAMWEMFFKDDIVSRVELKREDN